VSAIFVEGSCLGLGAQSTGLMLTITADFYDNLSGCACIQMGIFHRPRGQGLGLALPCRPKGNNVRGPQGHNRNGLKLFQKLREIKRIFQ